tara:strand:- start:18 stop:155 length:138 start_codon:yes stop_codon:yes gene_type:complete
MKIGDRIIIHEDKVKIIFGLHSNGNLLVKNKGTLVQVDKNNCRLW